MASAFVDKYLGFWSSHPTNLKKSKWVFVCLGLVPIILIGIGCVLVYKDLFSLKAFVEQIGLLTCAIFFSLGFLVTFGVLYLACFTKGSKQGRLSNADDFLPLWILLLPVVFFILAYLLDIPLLKKLAEHYPSNTFLKFIVDQVRNAKALLNLLAISPFVCILTWLLCAKEEELKEDERLVRRPLVLTIALVFLGLLVGSFFVPKYRLIVSMYMLVSFLVSFALWWGWKKKVKIEVKKAEAKEEEKKEEPKLPEQAEYIINNLPKGIRYEKDGGMKYPLEYGGEGEKSDSLDDNGDDEEQALENKFSPFIQEDESAFSLITLMNGKIPTEDQADFLNRFISSYEETLLDFFESGKPNSKQSLPDIILHGVEGSGRTEALCAAAVYASVVRGQNVLYIVEDKGYAQSLAERMQKRLRELLVDCYYTADYLKPNFVDSWLPQTGTKDGKKEDTALPPNILFATPEHLESSIFSNSNLADPKNREALRNILLSYSVILVDDLLEMSIPLQAHLAFILDKFRLLQASEYVMGQFVVATSPLNEYGIDGLAERLFGLSGFNPTKNVISLRPRLCDPIWCGTLRISSDFGGGEQGQWEKAARCLLKICTEKNYNTLLYSKGITKIEAEELEADFVNKGTVGKVSVSSHLYQLHVDKMPFDTIFYLSLTSGNAAAALRLSIPDDKTGTPVFFRIALDKEPEKTPMKQFALIPNETAISLRAYHLRSVLPFLPRLTPIPEAVWSHFGISLNHPFLRDAVISKMPDGLAVEWYSDSYTEPDRYGENEIWPYLVLASKSENSNLGQPAHFDILPSTKDGILRDKQAADSQGEALVFVSAAQGKTESESPSQLAVWRDPRGNQMVPGTTDLAHASLLTLLTADNHYSVNDIQAIDKGDKDASRYAIKIMAQPRRGLSYDIPVRRFAWNLPEGGFSVSMSDVKKNASQQEIASFSIDFGKFYTTPISAEIDGLMNSMGGSDSIRFSSTKYAYDAFLSCIVFLPETNCSDKDAICKSLAGKWATDAKCGFSAPLTHAFSIALRNRMTGISFFALTPVFMLEGRDESFGRLLLWVLEPYNSGCTVYPLLAKKLFRDHPKFKKELLEDIREILKKNNTLESLRKQSQLAFAGEDDPDKLSPEQWQSEIQRGLSLINLMLDSKARAQDAADRKKKLQQQEEERKQREEARRKRDEAQRKRKENSVDPSTLSDEDRQKFEEEQKKFEEEEKEYNEEQKQYQEFANVATAALMNFEDEINVSHFCVDYGWSKDKVKEVFNDFLWNSPEIFFVAKSHSMQFWQVDGRITSCFIRDIHYGIKKEEYAAAKRELDKEVAVAMQLIEGVTDPVKKALILHDHIVHVCDYDTKAAETHDCSPLARTVYSVLVRHLAVCEGYAMAYRYLLNCAGIQSEEVVSKKMCHCWNYLKINDNWYHVDVTWDDPVYQGGKPDKEVFRHDYFLLSDAKIACKNPKHVDYHYDWSVRGLPPATDTRFDNKDWSKY